MTRAAREAGFTLLEVLVALAILSIAVVACIEGFAQGLRLLKLAGDHQQAMLLADEKMREVVEPSEGHEQSVEGPFRWERVTRAVDAPDLAPPGVPPRFRVYEIDVRVSWDPRRHVEISTLRTVPLGVIPAAGTGGLGTGGLGTGGLGTGGLGTGGPGTGGPAAGAGGSFLGGGAGGAPSRSGTSMSPGRFSLGGSKK
jgi:type II secretion system protein I